METQERGVLQLELKYCERCGTLRLRLRGSEAVVCVACAKALAGLPGRRGIAHDSDMESATPMPLQSAFWAEGGNA